MIFNVNIQCTCICIYNFSFSCVCVYLHGLQGQGLWPTLTLDWLTPRQFATKTVNFWSWRVTHDVQYRGSLRAVSSRQSQGDEDRTAPDSHNNYCYLSTSRLHTSARIAKKHILRIQTRLAEVTAHSGVVVNSNTHHDMEHTPDIYQKHAPDSFPRLFWEQQQQASSLTTPSTMKWHLL